MGRRPNRVQGRLDAQAALPAAALCGGFFGGGKREGTSLSLIVSVNERERVCVCVCVRMTSSILEGCGTAEGAEEEAVKRHRCCCCWMGLGWEVRASEPQRQTETKPLI